MANAMVKLDFWTPGEGEEKLPVPAGAVKIRVQEKSAAVGQDKDGNDIVVYTWKDVGQHRAAQSGVHTELSKKQRLIVEIEGDI